MASAAMSYDDAVSSEQAQALTTIPQLCLDAIRRYAKADALNHKQEGQWLHIPAGAFIRRVRHVALGLLSWASSGDRVALLIPNRNEVDHRPAIWSLGGQSSIYTRRPRAGGFILRIQARDALKSRAKGLQARRPG